MYINSNKKYSCKLGYEIIRLDARYEVRTYINSYKIYKKLYLIAFGSHKDNKRKKFLYIMIPVTPLYEVIYQ